jgi:hypothetical protein
MQSSIRTQSEAGKLSLVKYFTQRSRRPQSFKNITVLLSEAVISLFVSIKIPFITLIFAQHLKPSYSSPFLCGLCVKFEL